MRRVPVQAIAETAVRAVSLVLNISFLISVAAVFSFVPVLAGSGRGLALALIFLVPALIAVILLIPFVFRKIFPKETAESVSAPPPSGRYDSARKGLLFGISADLLIMAAAGAVSIDMALSSEFLMVLALPPLAGLFLGCLHPWGRHAGKAGPYINSACLIGVFFLLAAYMAFDLVPREFHYETKFVEPDEYTALSGGMIRRMFPMGAEDVRIRGRLHVLGNRFQWSCRTSEDAVRAFFANTNREWRENDPCFNMNPAAGEERADRSGGVQPDGEKMPESFLFYSFIYRNGGGWIMLYDRGSGILRGSFSSR